MLIKHLQSGNSYGIRLKEKHCKFPQPELGSWVEGSRTVGADWQATRARGLAAARGALATSVGRARDSFRPRARQMLGSDGRARPRR